ncbi:MAG: hypothetical protein IJW27_07135 [Clostridia bacterium]|nr:hypothetical protein [Clostridia bacterium]
MKKFFLLILCLLIAFSCFGFSALAAGTDDGVISVAEVSGKKFFGTEKDDILTVYTAADGSGEIFYDLTKDKQMDVCDLVRLCAASADLSGDGIYNSEDGAIMRRLLIGLK